MTFRWVAAQHHVHAYTPSIHMPPEMLCTTERVYNKTFTEVGACVGAIHYSMFAGVVQDGALSESNICCHTSDCYSNKKQKSINSL